MNHVNTHDDDHRHLRWHGADDATQACVTVLINPEIYTTTAQYRGSRRHGSPTAFPSACLSVLPTTGHVLARLRSTRADADCAPFYSVPTGSVLLSRRGRGSSPHDGNCRGLSAPAPSFQPAQHFDRQVTDATPSHTKRRARLLRKLKRGKRNE